jgi:subtilisin family serine protease
MLANFSSVGPTFDSRIKPEVLARGVGVRCAHPSVENEYRNLDGTSFSTPLVSGAIVLLLEAFPAWTPKMVRDAVLGTADRARQPDNQYGYGIMDVLAALEYRHRGDVDGNGVLDESDVLLAADILLQRVPYTEEEYGTADMDENGTVDILDIVKLVNSLPES